jgi:hypothetical protein
MNRRSYEPLPAPDPDLVLKLVLKVREMLPHRPGRWAWDLRDSRDGSWFESMWEFDSEDRARRSGHSRLAELHETLPDATLVAYGAGAPRHRFAA